MNRFAPATWDQAKYRDLNNQLEALRKLAANRSPYYAWKAIESCIKRKKEFPEWIKEYLVGCAERMQSDRAARAGDTRKQLPWIFGFPPGRAGGLDQDLELIKETCKAAFAFHFAIKLYQGEDPVQARRNAGDEWFSIIDGRIVDDRTLQRYLREQFQLKNRRMPLTADEWMPLIDPRQLLAITKRLVSSLGGN